jgi:hypothetical protein
MQPPSPAMASITRARRPKRNLVHRQIVDLLVFHRRSHVYLVRLLSFNHRRRARLARLRDQYPPILTNLRLARPPPAASCKKHLACDVGGDRELPCSAAMSRAASGRADPRWRHSTLNCWTQNKLAARNERAASQSRCANRIKADRSVRSRLLSF